MGQIAYMEVNFRKSKRDNGVDNISYEVKGWEYYELEGVKKVSGCSKLGHAAKEVIHYGDKNYVQVLLLEDERNTNSLQWIEVPDGFGWVYKVSVEKNRLLSNI